MSGCEEEKTNQELVEGLREDYPNLSKNYAVGSDTEGSVASTSNRGGITCIAGTGSNTLLINPDGTRVQCGGWGNILGDEGGGVYTANTRDVVTISGLFQPGKFPTDRLKSVLMI